MEGGEGLKKKPIEYPYIPEGRKIEYVPMNNEFIQAAKRFAFEHSLDRHMPTGSVVVVEGEIVGFGANGSDYHENNECERKKLGSKTGTDYDKCEGCHPKNHSEPRAIADALSKGQDIEGADLYLWGHWWCCEPCWDSMVDAGIQHVYLAEGSEELFNKESERNIVNHQFDDVDESWK